MDLGKEEVCGRQGESRRDGDREKLAEKCCMREESDNEGKRTTE